MITIILLFLIWGIYFISWHYSFFLLFCYFFFWSVTSFMHRRLPLLLLLLLLLDQQEGFLVHSVTQLVLMGCGYGSWWRWKGQLGLLAGSSQPGTPVNKLLRGWRPCDSVVIGRTPCCGSYRLTASSHRDNQMRTGALTMGLAPYCSTSPPRPDDFSPALDSEEWVR